MRCHVCEQEKRAIGKWKRGAVSLVFEVAEWGRVTVRSQGGGMR